MHPAPRLPHRWDRWSTVFAGALGCAAGAGVIANYVFGLFIKPIAAEYGWGRSVTTASILCFYVACGVGCLMLSHIMARWGVRRATILFVTLFAASIMLVGFLPKSVFLFCLVFGAMGFFGSAASLMPYAVAISGWFDKKRGLALALAVSGTGLSATFMPSYANWLLINYGWRGGYIGVGLFCAVVALVGLLFFFRMPPDRSAERSPGLGDWRSLMTPDYARIGIPVFLISVAMLGCITNIAPIFTDRGMTTGQAAGLLGILGAASWVSRLAVGILLDRFHVRYVAAAIFALVSAGVAVLMSGADGIGPTFAVIAIGLGIGSEADMIAYAVSRYFPSRQLSGALGAVWLLWMWGAGAGVVIGSLSFDLTGTYTVALGLFLAMALASTGLILTLGRYPDREQAV